MIRPIGYLPTDPRVPSKPASSAGGFSVPEAAAATSPAPRGPAAPAFAELLALQQVDTTAGQNQQATDHGFAMLDGLTALQRSLVSGDNLGESLNSLAKLSDAVPVAADPKLNDIVTEIDQRVRIELARWQG